MTAKKSSRFSKLTKQASKRDDEEDHSDHDDIDKFYQQRSIIMLDDAYEQQEEASNSDSEAAVLELGDSDGGFGGSSQEDDEIEEEEDGDKNESASNDPRESDNESEKDSIDLNAWGKRKSTYYSADTTAGKEEAAEAMRLQRTKAAMLAEEDYGSLESISEAESEASTPPVDMDHETAEGLSAFATSHADFAQGLVADYQDKMLQVRETLQPIVEKASILPTSHGLSFLQAKYHLLLSYCTNICFFMLLKCNGKRVEGHPVIASLVRLRAQIEKLKPIEAKLKHQIDRLLTAALNGKASQDDMDVLSHKPRLHELTTKEEDARAAAQSTGHGIDGDGDGHDGEADALYRPPKLAPVYFEDKASREKRKEQVDLENERRSRLLRELQSSDSDMAPEEEVGDIAAFHSSAQKDAKRTAFEEDHFTRTTLTNKESKASQRLQKYKMSNILDELNDFAIMQSDQEDSDLRMTQHGKKTTTKASLTDPASSRRQKNKREESDENIDSDELSDIEGSWTARRRTAKDVNDESEEDEFYKSAKKSKKTKKPQSNSSGIMPSQDYDPYHNRAKDAKRPASYQMIKNKGLMPARSKDQRNPRVRQRHRYEKSEKRIKGFKRSAGHAGKTPYQGEKTGIRTHLTKSVKFA